jgi:hypothetical protein
MRISFFGWKLGNIVQPRSHRSVLTLNDEVRICLYLLLSVSGKFHISTRMLKEDEQGARVYTS